MNKFDINLGKSSQITILPLSDLHIGDGNANMNLIKETLDYAQKNDNCYLILNGDLINNAIVNSKSNIYEDILTPREQLNTLIKLLTPVANKIILLSTGNHEFRTDKATGNDPLDYVCAKLNIKNYADNSWFLTLRFGKSQGCKDKQNIYTIYGTHGSGNGGAISTTIKSLEQMANVVSNADLYLHSHTHQFVTFTKPVKFWNAGADKIIDKQRIFVNTPSFVEYGGYAEMFGTTPKDIRPIKITIQFKRTKDGMIPQTTVSQIEN